MSISPSGSAEAPSSVSSGVTGAWAERRTPGIQRIAPSASQTTGRPHRSSLRHLPVDQDLLHLLLAVPRIPAGARPERPDPVPGPQRANRERQRQAGRVEHLGVTLRREALRLRRGTLPPGFPGERNDPTLLTKRNFVLPGGGDQDGQCFPRTPILRISGPFRVLPARRAPLRTGWPVSTPCRRSRVRRVLRSKTFPSIALSNRSFGATPSLSKQIRWRIFIRRTEGSTENVFLRKTKPPLCPGASVRATFSHSAGSTCLPRLRGSRRVRGTSPRG